MGFGLPFSPQLGGWSGGRGQGRLSRGGVAGKTGGLAGVVSLADKGIYNYLDIAGQGPTITG